MAMSGLGKGDLNSDINVTPLVDVMLVLLIIFMVTAPMLQTGVDLDLPQVDVPAVQDDEGKLVLSLDRAGKLFLGDTPVPWDELEVKLTTNAKLKAEHELYIDADKNIPYGQVIQVMAMAKKAGVTKLLMMTDPASSAGEKPTEKPTDKPGDKPTTPAVR